MPWVPIDRKRPPQQAELETASRFTTRISTTCHPLCHRGDKWRKASHATLFHVDLLNETEVRVLASLIEKESTTPEYYPLSLNALMLACNQKTNREPVVAYDEDTVSDALDSLRAKRIDRNSTRLNSSHT